MKKGLIQPGLFVAFMAAAQLTFAQAKLEPVFKDNTYQLTGVAVSKSGRIFINYPYWSDTYKYALVEVMKDGSVKPYPDAAWNSWKMGTEPNQSLGVCSI